jgi:ATP-dependent RNA helicase RhlE
MSYSFRSIQRPGARGARYGQRRQSQNRSRNQGQYIDPRRFVKPASASEAEAYQPTNKFADFQVDQLIHQNLVAKGFETPTPIQDQTIPAALEGRDIIGIASTGTGKTAAFALPILHRLITQPKVGALIIAPTRELAEQIEQECRTLGKGSGLSGALLIGGTGMAKQLRDLKQNPRIIVGTPGRIKDHLQRGTLKLEYVSMVVLDEVDRMLDMGFVHDVTHILSHLPEQRQSFFFSATIEQSVHGLIDRFTSEPFTVSLKASSASENVNQDVVDYSSATEKLDKLHNLLISSEVKKVILFDETQRSVERLNNELMSRGFSVDAIHGGKTQGQRKRALSKFKQNEINILVATDVAARGIDVADITHVINFSVPKAYDDYIHRIGRAGRAGQTGYALTFVPR